MELSASSCSVKGYDDRQYLLIPSKMSVVSLRCSTVILPSSRPFTAQRDS